MVAPQANQQGYWLYHCPLGPNLAAPASGAKSTRTAPNRTSVALLLPGGWGWSVGRQWGTHIKLLWYKTTIALRE